MLTSSGETFSAVSEKITRIFSAELFRGSGKATVEFIQFDSRSRRQEKPGPASSPERVRRRPGAARQPGSPHPDPGRCRRRAAQCRRGGGPRDVREGARAGVWGREATEGRGPPPPGRPEPEAVGSRGGEATQSQRSRQRRGVTRAAPAEAASTPPAGVTCGLVSNGLKSFRAGVVYAATAHAPA